MMSGKLLKLFSQNKAFLILLLTGVVSWSLVMVKSGIVYSYGMGFWGPNGHDGVWHLALIQSLSKGSLEMPIFAGETIKNYHIGFDLLIALIYRLTKIPVHNLYFQIIPPIIAMGTGILSYIFVLRWRKSKIEAFWATFFVYFGGNFGWIVTLIRDKALGGESLFWSQQSTVTLINPPYALSLLFILGGLNLILLYRERSKFIYLLLSGLLFGILIEIKVYASILSLFGLFVAGVAEYLKEKKSSFISLFLISLIISLIVFIPLNRNAPNLIAFQPFWFLETMMGLPDRFYWPKFYGAMINYRLGNVWVKAVPAYVFAFSIFWIGNLGTRIIKELIIFRWIKDTRKISPIEIFLIVIIISGGVLPLLFLQRGTPWNTIQFIYYSLFASGILAGVVFGEWFKASQKGKSFLLSTILILFTLPTTFATLKHYLPLRPPAKLSKEEMEALNFLKNKESGIVLTYPFDKETAKMAEENPPRPLYLYESTAYVSAFSEKPVYLEDEVNLSITDYPWTERRRKAWEFFLTSDFDEAKRFLGDNNIRYIYRVDKQRIKLDENQLGIVKIFENKEVNIFEIIY